MKKVYSLLLRLSLLFLCAPVNAQITLSKDLIQPREGDRLTKQQVSYKDLGRSGESVLWNLGRVEVLDSRYRQKFVRLDSHPDEITAIGHSTRYYYNEKEDSLLIDGMENSRLKVVYDKPLVEMLYPLAYGKTFSGIYHGRGVYCDKSLYREFGTCYGCADATGILILSEGDTLRNVIRLHIVKKTGTHYYPSDSIHNISSIKPFTEDSVRMYMDKDMSIVTTNIYRWYAPGYRYPVLETITIGDSRDEMKTTSFVASPEDQATSIEDAANLTLRELYGNAPPHGTPDAGDLADFTYNVIHRDDGLAIEYSLNSERSFSCRLYSLGGMLLWEQKTAPSTAGVHTLDIPKDRLMAGAYLLAFRIGEHTVTEKGIFGNN